MGLFAYLLIISHSFFEFCVTMNYPFSVLPDFVRWAGKMDKGEQRETCLNFIRREPIQRGCPFAQLFGYGGFLTAVWKINWRKPLHRFSFHEVIDDVRINLIQSHLPATGLQDDVPAPVHIPDVILIHNVLLSHGKQVVYSPVKYQTGWEEQHE